MALHSGEGLLLSGFSHSLKTERWRHTDNIRDNFAQVGKQTFMSTTGGITL